MTKRTEAAEMRFHQRLSGISLGEGGTGAETSGSSELSRKAATIDVVQAAVLQEEIE